MKGIIVALTALVLLLLVFGCDPFGSDKTMTYLTGTIYTDAAMTIPAEGIVVELVVDPDSSAVRPQTVTTNAAGVFFIESQMYPSIPAEGSTGYTMPNTVKVGLVAHYGAKEYVYKTVEDGFILTAGDTLTVWPVDLASFSGGSGGGQ